MASITQQIFVRREEVVDRKSNVEMDPFCIDLCRGGVCKLLEVHELSALACSYTSWLIILKYSVRIK